VRTYEWQYVDATGQKYNQINYQTDEIMLLISSLCEKCLINMIVKQENKVMKEFIDPFTEEKNEINKNKKRPL